MKAADLYSEGCLFYVVVWACLFVDRLIALGWLLITADHPKSQVDHRLQIRETYTLAAAWPFVLLSAWRKTNL